MLYFPSLIDLSMDQRMYAWWRWSWLSADLTHYSRDVMFNVVDEAYSVEN